MRHDGFFISQGIHVEVGGIQGNWAFNTKLKFLTKGIKPDTLCALNLEFLPINVEFCYSCFFGFKSCESDGKHKRWYFLTLKWNQTVY